MLTQLMIFVDCLISTAEQKQLPLWSIVLSVCIQWLLAYLNIVLGRIDIPPPQYTMICFELMNFMCWCAYFGLILIGRFKYKTQQVGFIGEKFQLSVQIRTLNVLKILGIYSAIKNLIDINVILLLDVWIRPKNIEGGERVVSFFYDLSLSLYALVVPLHMLISHPEMLRKLKEQFLHIKHQEERAFVFRNAVGESLTRPNANEHHFQELHVQWNSPQQNLQI